MKHASYHRAGAMIPLEFEQTDMNSLEEHPECFIMHLNHRDYPLHATEVLDVFEKSKAALIAWLTAVPEEYRPLVFGNSPELEAFYRTWCSSNERQ